jgi:hypothetical protein
MRCILLAGTALSMISAAPVMAQSFNPGYSAPWWAQVNLTPTLEQNANGGAGAAIGFVDTGVVASNAEIVGRVSRSACAAVTFRCSSGFTDDNGHGTATASIAAGNMGHSGIMTGVASRATIIAEKVLNASGSGYDVDVANGIVKATQAGASVINLSLTYLPTSSVISAINYAAANGVYVVFAGGNSAAPLNGGAPSNGFSATALKYLVFAGSVNSSNQLSSFSNTPGTGSATTGTGSISNSYASLWLMAPGESIVAPGIMYGRNAYAYWTGTSMAAPMVSGAIALLETTWPVLRKNGEAAQILFQSATDLGAQGVDSTYGNGLLNIGQAFQPSGALTVTQANGKTVAVNSLSSSLLSGGALGSLSRISGQLANYTAFDAYQRNFTVNLSGLIGTRPSTSASVAAAAQAPVVTGTTTHFADGGALSLTRADDPNLFSFASPGRLGLVAQNNSGTGAQPAGWAFQLTQPGGSVIAAGSGLPGSASFADTLWGPGSRAAEESRTLGVSNSLLSLADGGTFTGFGTQLNPHTRIAFSAVETQAAAGGLGSGATLSNSLMGGNTWTQPVATGFGIGIASELDQGWTGGVTLNYLHERNGLLGTTYADGGGVGLGGNHSSVSLGFSTGYEFGPDTGLLFDFSLARSDGGSVADGLVTGVSSTLSRAYGVAFVEQNAFTSGDHLSIGIRRPLTVIAGSANVATTSVDDQGNAVTSTTRVGLAPSSRETDLLLSYGMPWRYGINFSANLTVRRDADNIAGNKDALALLGARLSF